MPTGIPKALYKSLNSHQDLTNLLPPHSIPRVCTTYEELINDPSLDVIYVALPTGLHGDITKAALKAGKHVLCEKPFTANSSEAR